MKREGKGFFGRVPPLFQTMMVQAPKEVGEGSSVPTDPHHTSTTTQPSISRPQKKQKPRRKQKKGTEVPSSSGEPITDEAANVASVSTHSNDLLLSGEDRLQLTKLINLCTNLQKKVLDLEEAKTAQAKEIANLKKIIKKLEKRRKSRTPGLKRLRKVGSARRVESSDDFSLGAQEDKVEVEKVVSTAKVTTASATTTTVDESTLAQTLIEIKAAKPKAVTTTATITTTVVIRPKARGVVVQEPSEFRT
ncbi:hypothetical protein Tco_1208780, partial [Tanacetum coccineum]